MDKPRCGTRNQETDHSNSGRGDHCARRRRNRRACYSLARRGSFRTIHPQRNRSGQHRWSTDQDVVDLTRALARLMPDKLIASALNRAGKVTGRGNGWTQSRVCSLRNHHQIDAYRTGERQERGELTLDEAAEALAVSPSSVRRLIRECRLPAQQFCKGAPWIIKLDDIGSKDVIEAAKKKRGRRPPPEDLHQKTLAL